MNVWHELVNKSSMGDVENFRRQLKGAIGCDCRLPWNRKLQNLENA
jgi:hypothetical protein